MIRDTSFELVPGVRERHLYYLNGAGNPMAVYLLRVRTRKGKLGIEAATPFNQDTFARQTVPRLMHFEQSHAHRVVAGVNADFFNMKNGTPLQMEFKAGRALRDTLASNRGFMAVLKNGRLLIGDSVAYRHKKRRISEALGGYQILVKRGKVIPQPQNAFSVTRHPRTAAALLNAHTIVFVIVDGRQPAYSNGMPLDELAQFLKWLGATEAINLDGGGSSTLVSGADPADWAVRNRPSDGAPRAVANGWIVVSYAH